VRAMIKGGEHLVLDFHAVGYRPTPADEYPIIGRVAGIAGLYIAVMHSGITNAPSIGAAAAESILKGSQSELIKPYGIERFLGP